MKTLFNKCLTMLLSLVLMLTNFSHVVLAQDPEYLGEGSSQQIVLVDDPDYDHYFVMKETVDGVTHEFEVFCLNSGYAWPTGTTNFVPNFSDDMTAYFVSHPEVFEMVRRAMFAGYPNNGAGLYELVSEYVSIDTAMFNAMVKPSAEVIKLLEDLGYSDAAERVFNVTDEDTGTLNDPDSREFEMLQDLMFHMDEWGLSNSEVDLKKLDDLYSSPCFDALLSVYMAWVYDEPSTYMIKMIYDDTFGGKDYYVTKGNCYGATQEAIWHILKKYGAPHNDIEGLDKLSFLAQRIVAFAESDIPVPAYDVSADDINANVILRETSDLHPESSGTPTVVFSRNPEDGKYYSQELIIYGQEDANDKPIYQVSYDIYYGDAKSAQTVTNNEPFRLVLDEAPSSNMMTIKTNLLWPSPLYQYGTTEKVYVAFNDYDFYYKPIQHMGGLYLKEKELSIIADVEVSPLGTLTITKTIESGFEEAAENKEFWFKAKLNGVSNGWFPYEKGNTNEQLYVFDDGYLYFNLKSNESITIKDLPAGVTYEVNEYGLNKVPTPGDNSPLGDWSPEYTDETGTIGATTHVYVENKYQLTPADVTLTASKTLVNDADGTKMPLTGGEFEFMLFSDVHGQPMPLDPDTVFNEQLNRSELVKTNGETSADGVASVNFGSIRFEEAGTYYYTIEELNTELENVSKDPAHFNITVEVTRNGSALEAEVTVNNSSTVQPEFINTYSETEIVEEIIVSKSVLNESSDEIIRRDDFRFTLTPEDDSDKYPVLTADGSKSMTVETDESGMAVSGPITFNETWFNENEVNGEVKLTYNINEVDTGIDFIEYDGNTAKAVITVSKTADGYSSKTEYFYKDADGNNVTSKESAVFTNIYSAEGEMDFDVYKQFTESYYVPSANETYRFRINDDFGNDASGYKLPAGKTISYVFNEDGSYTVNNKTVDFYKAGEYRFELSEINDHLSGITYDEKNWIVDVKVTDDGMGNLVADAYYYHEGDSSSPDTLATFTNSHKSVVTATVDVTKQMLGRDLEDGDLFNVLITHSKGVYNPNVMDDHTDMTHPYTTVLSKNFDSYTIHGISFYNEGTYYMYLREVEPVSNFNMEYDSEVHTVRFTVARDGNDLTITDTSLYEDGNWVTMGPVVFTNKVNSLTITKYQNEGSTTASYEFEITMSLDDFGTKTPLSYTTVHALLNDTETELQLNEDGKATFNLKRGDSLKMVGLPLNVICDIEETTDIPCDTIHGMVIDGELDVFSIAEGKTVTVTPTAGEVTEVIFENTDIIYTGDLSVKKTVTGDLGDKTKEFEFTVTFYDDTETELTDGFLFDGSYSGTIKSGESFKLKHNESITIKDIPEGVTYKVTEKSYSSEGYTTVKRNAESVIAKDETKLAEFVNSKSSSSGGESRPVVVNTATK